MNYPIEVLAFSYQQIGEKEYVVLFTVYGTEMQPILVPECDPISLISCICKMIRVLSDPVGDCINDIPF